MASPPHAGVDHDPRSPVNHGTIMGSVEGSNSFFDHSMTRHLTCHGCTTFVGEGGLAAGQQGLGMHSQAVDEEVVSP